MPNVLEALISSRIHKQLVKSPRRGSRPVACTIEKQIHALSLVGKNITLSLVILNSFLVFQFYVLSNIVLYKRYIYLKRITL